MKNWSKKLNEILFLALLMVGIGAGCGKWNPPLATLNPAVPSATITATMTNTVTGTISSTATLTATPSLTTTITSTSTVTSTLTATASSTATATVTSTATSTATPTSAAACPNPAAVDLGTAGNYVILAETGITDVPSSDITGDVANSGTGAQIGLTCPEVTGVIYQYDAAGLPCFTQATAAIDIAVLDKGTAYSTANGLADCVVELGAGTVSGQTLTRGTYVWAGNVTIPTDLHLDALGDADARWVFQIGGTLNMAPAMTVHLDNGALAQNVIWTVADYVEIGTTAHFEGTIISHSYIALKTGASVHGRLLSHTQVTLEQNVVTAP